MVLLPGLLRVPMKFEKEFGDAWESRDYKRILHIFEGHSLNGGEGPGYRGYLFYSLYEINLATARYRSLSENLSYYGKEYLKKSYIKSIKSLRRSFIHMLSIREQRFMARYGLNEEWLRVKILSRTPSMRVENYYYKVLLDDISRLIGEGARRSNNGKVREGMRSSIKMGIELSLLLAWFLFLNIYALKMVEKLLDRDEVERIYMESCYGEASIKLLYKLSGYFSIGLSNALRFFPHKLHTHSISSYGSVKRGAESILWMGFVERCWSHVFLLHLRKSGLIEDDSIGLVCEVCMVSWRSLYKYVRSGFSEVEVSNGSKGKMVCVIRINAHVGSNENRVDKELGVEEASESYSD
jgi:hypothetical protein